MRRGALLVVLLPMLAHAQALATFRNGSAGYSGMRDVAIIGDDGEPWQPTVNYEGRDNWVDGSPNNEATLMRFDVSVIPSAAIVSSATLTLTFLDDTSSSYPIYGLNRPWVAGQATWNNATTAQAWQIAGAQGSLDRGTVSFATVTGSGTVNFPFTVNGRNAVQNWIASGTNNGFILQDYVATNGANIAHCDHATVASRPQLFVNTNMGVFAFRNGSLPVATYSGCTDVAIASGLNPETTNWDNSSNFELDTTKSIWVGVDLTSVPAWATVVSASMDVTIVSGLTGTFDLFEARRRWVEGQATWLTWDGIAAWQLAGGQGALDRDSTVVGQFVNPGANTAMVFNDAGLALVERWVRQPNTNLGFVVWNPLIPDSCRYSESEVGTVTSRPRFNLGYFEGQVGFGSAAGLTGTPAAIALTREQLDRVPIAAGAPALSVAVSTAAPAQLSTDGGGWTAAMLVTIPAGASTAPVFVLSPVPGTVVVRSDAGAAWVGGTFTVVFADAGPPDAGPPDAGTPDAGANDAGANDAGVGDAGTDDAGTGDAGALPGDAGTGDAGTPPGDAGTPDAGTFPTDGGAEPGPRTVGVGCDCSAAGGDWLLALLVLAVRRRFGYGHPRCPPR